MRVPSPQCCFYSMLRRLLKMLLVLWVGTAFSVAHGDTSAIASAPKKARVIVIPVREQIADPVLFIIRRGLKENADAVVLDMDTPGGSLGTTFEILEALEKFPGKTITYVNKDAVSAGSFIAAVTQKIYFAPNGVIGAAAPVSSKGEDIEKTMHQKIVSYLKARIRAISEGKGIYRAQVISAMIDSDFELKIGDQVLKPKGELLSLTANEASKTYGEPPQPLLAAGIAPTIDDVLTREFGAGNYEVQRFEVTWSEKLAQFLNGISPVLLGLAMLAMFIEMKTPGFGVFGVTSIVLFVVVFLSSYAAGLSGHEPMIVFVIGLALVIVEVLLLPGVAILAGAGLLMMIGSLIWAMADLWPNEPITLSGDVFVRPLANLALGLAIAVGLALLLARFIPRGWFFDRLAIAGASTAGAARSDLAATGASPWVGRAGVAATGLFPSGYVVVDGQRFEARAAAGYIDAGTPIVVSRKTEFEMVVEKARS
jgi:membrane-bound serine protease (ClpP class)